MFFFSCAAYDIGRRLKGRLGPYLVSHQKIKRAKDVGTFQRRLLGVSWSRYAKRQIVQKLAPLPEYCMYIFWIYC